MCRVVCKIAKWRQEELNLCHMKLAMAKIIIPPHLVPQLCSLNSMLNYRDELLTTCMALFMVMAP